MSPPGVYEAAVIRSVLPSRFIEAFRLVRDQIVAVPVSAAASTWLESAR